MSKNNNRGGAASVGYEMPAFITDRRKFLVDKAERNVLAPPSGTVRYIKLGDKATSLTFYLARGAETVRLGLSVPARPVASGEMNAKRVLRYVEGRHWQVQERPVQNYGVAQIGLEDDEQRGAELTFSSRHMVIEADAQFDRAKDLVWTALSEAATKPVKEFQFDICQVYAGALRYAANLS